MDYRFIKDKKRLKNETPFWYKRVKTLIERGVQGLKKKMIGPLMLSCLILGFSPGFQICIPDSEFPHRLISSFYIPKFPYPPFRIENFVLLNVFAFVRSVSHCKISFFALILNQRFVFIKKKRNPSSVRWHKYEMCGPGHELLSSNA